MWDSKKYFQMFSGMPNCPDVLFLRCVIAGSST
jgi:hypothetical protein